MTDGTGCSAEEGRFGQGLSILACEEQWDESRKRKDDGEICITLFILVVIVDISHAFVSVVDVQSSE